MKTGKDVIFAYCNTVETHDIDHLQHALENKRYIESNEYDMLNGCPSTFGLDEHIGFCEIEDIGHDLAKQTAQCEACWIAALSSEQK